MENILERCSSCGTTVNGNYCSECGQKKFKKIDRSYVMDEAMSFAYYTEKGFFYSVKNIILNPGKTARKFLEGDRIHHYKPFALTMVLSGISVLLSNLLGIKEILEATMKASNKDITDNFAESYSTGFLSYFSFIMLAFIPFFSVLTKLAFRKWGQNYYEHLVMNAYFQCFYSIVTMVLLFPFYYFFQGNAEVIMKISLLFYIVIPFLLFWFYKGFYTEKSTKSIIGRLFIFFLLCVAAFIIVFILLILAGILVAMFNPEMVKEMVKVPH
ncbi:hypothetical protein ATB99_16180 [Elizabethkingia meningoseptica]|uniref:DUF3667 domain-containing protein n=1 Tax=Elizabethkingia meningoseptica TaxID=238 RepID=UPI000362C8FA|nr:DUF3667 domain-containing protein [Elizabethkingia meningoseptica]AQX06088.1 hypothetical protein BBD33_12865 [Elizabethkingia meningoseptica]AQX48134.1 hypothetical protein B5G46_12855 [Elizabethkingia meningoseptica]KUY23321.1 hypothetical protein ATB99_16180 [Elizabethkingia meningoseptica]OPB71469.1 hypothetical protein BAY30_02535 [Elizabethkingia meningoseptica]QDZ60311.1 DUF3667 domain-containing protein [Elizabethkingia meningoseptica]